MAERNVHACRRYHERKSYTSIIDVGCGSAYKLVLYFEEYKTTGIEVEPYING